MSLKEFRPQKTPVTESEKDACESHITCGKKHAQTNRLWFWYCTRSQDHKGKHIAAGDDNDIFAEWNNEDEDDKDKLDKLIDEVATKGRYSPPKTQRVLHANCRYAGMCIEHDMDPTVPDCGAKP